MQKIMFNILKLVYDPLTVCLCPHFKACFVKLETRLIEVQYVSKIQTSLDLVWLETVPAAGAG